MNNFSVHIFKDIIIHNYCLTYMASFYYHALCSHYQENFVCTYVRALKVILLWRKKKI